jgi:hypothetical protein
MAMRQSIGLSACAAMLAGLALPGPALAYRPFDGTDAAVADVHEVEVELQPAGIERSSGQKTLIAPAFVYNYGFVKNWELVLEGQLETPLSPSGPSTFTQSGAFFKGVLRPGSLQDQSRPSIATEFGVLLPDSHGPGGTGASVAAIISQRWDWGTVHFNVEGLRTRDQHAGAFTSVILEGPSKWVVRPVAEVSYEETFGQMHTVAGLVGAIWQVRDNLAFDVAVKHSVSSTGHADEIRAGVTFGFSVTSLGGPSHH